MSTVFIRLPNHLGDACMSLPALELVAARGHSLVLAGKPWAARLFAAYPWRVLPLDGTAFEQRRVLREAFAAIDDATRVLLLTNSIGSALVFRIAGRRSTGFSNEARGWLLRRRVKRPQGHAVETYYALGQAFIEGEFAGDGGPPVPSVPSELALRLDESSRARAQQAVAAVGIDGDYLMLCPVAVGLHRGRVKAWSGFARLSAELRARGLAVLACPGPGERDAVVRAVPAATLLSETDVGTFAALLAGSRAVVANDSGAGHLAAAVGARLISVFGVTDPAQTRPWGSRVTLLGSADGWPPYDAVVGAVDAALAA